MAKQGPKQVLRPGRGYAARMRAPAQMRANYMDPERVSVTYGAGSSVYWTCPPRVQAIAVRGKGQDGDSGYSEWGYDSYTTATRYDDNWQQIGYSETYRGTTYYQYPPGDSCSQYGGPGMGYLIECWEYRSFDNSYPGSVGASSFMQEVGTNRVVAMFPGGDYDVAIEQNAGIVSVIPGRQYYIYVPGGFINLNYLK